jgi:hypothetical protein
MTFGDDLTHCRMNVIDVTLGNAMVMPCRVKKRAQKSNLIDTLVQMSKFTS